jgi:hypothetical protein
VGRSRRAIEEEKYVNRFFSLAQTWRSNSSFAERICAASVRAILVALLPLLVPLPGAPQTEPNEVQVKAAFVLHFAQLVEWPAEAVGADNQPVIFCVAGEHIYVSALVAVTQDKQILGHPITVRRVREKEDARACLLLFIAGNNRMSSSTILSRLKDAPVLTVGEPDNFVQQGGMIGLCLQDNKIRFDINLTASQHANLTISSRLLVLARNVIGGGKQG